MANGAPQAQWYDPIIEFAAHLFVGTVIFALTGVATAGLHYVVLWLESLGLDASILLIFKGLEYVVLVLDVLVFAVYLLGAAIKAIWEVGTQVRKVVGG